jgi:MinD-like ATPase involved in chromosome partitioning or flagellar assembly
VVVASGMNGTGVSTIAARLQEAASALDVIDAGARWADIAEACAPGFARMLVVTTHDIVSITSAYALIKLVRDRFSDAPIEIVVNHSDERDALRTYERIQVAASHFLGETVGYAGAVPSDVLDQEPVTTSDAAHGGVLGANATMALHDLATRLDEELGPTASRSAWRSERRLAS